MPLQVERDTCRSEFRTRDGAVVLAPPACSTAAGRGLRLHGCSFRLRPCRLLLILRDPPAPLPNLRRRLLGPLQPTQLRSLHPDSLLQGPWVPLGTQKLLHLQARAKARRVRQGADQPLTECNAKKRGGADKPLTQHKSKKHQNPINQNRSTLMNSGARQSTPQWKKMC